MRGHFAALAGNRTRVNCLGSSYAIHYTTNACQRFCECLNATFPPAWEMYTFCSLNIVNIKCSICSRCLTQSVTASKLAMCMAIGVLLPTAGQHGNCKQDCWHVNTPYCVGRESNPGQLLGRQLCSPLYHQRMCGVASKCAHTFVEGCTRAYSRCFVSGDFLSFLPIVISF